MSAPRLNARNAGSRKWLNRRYAGAARADPSAAWRPGPRGRADCHGGRAYMAGLVALVATAGALGVGRLAPRLLHVAPWPYVLLGVGYAGLAIGLIAVGAYRQRSLQRAVTSGANIKLDFRLVAVFSVGGVLLALTTIALVLVQA